MPDGLSSRCSQSLEREDDLGVAGQVTVDESPSTIPIINAPDGGSTRGWKICLHQPPTDLASHPSMKTLVFIPAILFLASIFSSCGLSCNGCSHKYVEIEEVEWIEEEVVTEPGPKGGPGETVKVRRPVVKTVRKAVRCTDCGSWYCADSDCCGTVSSQVRRRATSQGASGEPHIGLIPTMHPLAPEEN